MVMNFLVASTIILGMCTWSFAGNGEISREQVAQIAKNEALRLGYLLEHLEIELDETMIMFRFCKEARYMKTQRNGCKVSRQNWPAKNIGQFISGRSSNNLVVICLYLWMHALEISWT